mmetsp:Transcript_34088/g.89061  ORF Transcript_34088/g.89061 Transcript_34088/m.89061 type:complete len:210 (+) Transcript_34088:1999-2628(+)
MRKAIPCKLCKRRRCRTSTRVRWAVKCLILGKMRCRRSRCPTHQRKARMGAPQQSRPRWLGNRRSPAMRGSAQVREIGKQKNSKRGKSKATVGGALNSRLGAATTANTTATSSRQHQRSRFVTATKANTTATGSRRFPHMGRAFSSRMLPSSKGRRREDRKVVLGGVGGGKATDGLGNGTLILKGPGPRGAIGMARDGRPRDGVVVVSR